MSGWEERMAYFYKHGPHPAEPFIKRSECGCYEIWRTPEMGELHKCEHDSALSRREMRALQNRRHAAAGLPKPWEDE